jgi:hypothetical protein
MNSPVPVEHLVRPVLEFRVAYDGVCEWHSVGNHIGEKLNVIFILPPLERNHGVIGFFRTPLNAAE